MEVEDWSINQILEKTNLTREQIEEKLKKKLEEFPALTREAAIRAVAADSGVILIRRDYKVSDIKEEINHLNLRCSIIRKFEAREVNLRGGRSKILNLIVGDETGQIRVVVWDTNKIAELESSFNEGDEILIINAYSKFSSFSSNFEVNIGKNTLLKMIERRGQAAKEGDNYSRISQINEENKVYRVRGFITRLFTNNTFIVRCRICGKRVDDKCDVHGDKALSKTLMISAVIDDGLSNMKVVFFDRVAEKLLSLSKEGDLRARLNDISFGIYQVEIEAVAKSFNGVLSLTVKDVRPVDYSL
ncbi:MAG: hypothetical protein OH316_01240 [Candidatus Parvarchaeota archaeon]|nr:hypothetical protein [Candidatus Parvarchaeota archaeon]MCW1301743.1 hypothetical protein [Candidatus Parvarchaeota archaeon]